MHTAAQSSHVIELSAAMSIIGKRLVARLAFLLRHFVIHLLVLIIGCCSVGRPLLMDLLLTAIQGGAELTAGRRLEAPAGSCQQQHQRCVLQWCCWRYGRSQLLWRCLKVGALIGSQPCPDSATAVP